MAELHDAIKRKDLDEVKTILNNEANCDFKWGELTNQFWLDLFLIYENYFHRKMGRRPTAKQLATQMPFLVPFVKAGDISLSELTTRPVFAIAALLLEGVEASVKAEALVRSSIIQSNGLHKDKKADLYDLLWKNKILTKHPFELADVAQLLLTGPKRLLDLVLKHDTEILMQSDMDGNNIVHHITQIKPASVLGAIKRLQEYIGSGELIKLLTQFNHKNQLAVQEVLFRRPTRILPVVIEALEVGCKTGDLFRTDRFFELIRMNSWLLFFIVNRTDSRYIPQIEEQFVQLKDDVDEARLRPLVPKGIIANMPEEERNNYNIEKKSRKERDEARLLKKARKSDFRRSAQQTVELRPTGFTDSDTFPIHELPRELIDLILNELNGGHRFNFFQSNKALFTMLKKTDERYWQAIHEDFFLPTVSPIFSYKKRCLNEYKYKDNWRNNKCRQIVLNGKKPVAMDENWLLLEDKKSFYWWNCHTQQLSGPKLRPAPSNEGTISLRILPNYKEDQIPSYVLVQKSFVCIATGDQVVRCKGLPDPFIYPTKITVLKDNRFVVSSRSGLIIYDYVEDKITASIKYKGHFAFVYNTDICYNMSANLLARIAGRIKFYSADSLDMVHKTRFNCGSYCTLTGTSYSDFAYTHYYGLGFFTVDHKVVDHEVFDLKATSEARSMNRFITWNKETNLLMCWNIGLRQYEWIQVSTVRPKVANTRYWVGTSSEYTTVVYDYHGPA